MSKRKANGHASSDGAHLGEDVSAATAEALAEAIEQASDGLAQIELASETLTGDLRDFILDRLRHEQSKRPWHERSETDQRETVHQVEAAVRRAVTRAVEIIAAEGRRTIRATLEQVVVKDGIKAVLLLSKQDQQRHSLMDATGSTVLVVVADPDVFEGERAPVEVKPDQGDLVEVARVVHADTGAATENEAPFA